jgi:hypothetical protein
MFVILGLLYGTGSGGGKGKENDRVNIEIHYICADRGYDIY